MIYFFVERKKNDFNNELFYFLSVYGISNFKYRIIYFDNLFVSDYKFESLNISNDKDIIFWNSLLASKNLEYIKENANNNFIILSKPTVLIQQESDNNPITENMCINNGLKLLYLNPENIDITNENYRLIVDDSYFKISDLTFKKLLEKYGK